MLDGTAGLIALDADDAPVGIVTWSVDAGGGRAEIRAVGVADPARGHGIGRAMLERAHAALAATGARSVWLVTTNDNAPAIRLYETLGYVVTHVRRGAVDEMRRTLKPSIPLLGHGGVEMHDELELERGL